MIEHVLIRGVVMGENQSGQKLVKPLMNNADGLRIWTDDKHLIPTSDVVKLPKGKPGDCVEWDNGVCKQIYCIKAIIIEKDCVRYDLGSFAPVVNHNGIVRVLTLDEAMEELGL